MKSKSISTGLVIFFLVIVLSFADLMSTEGSVEEEADIQYIESDDGNRIPVVQDPCQMKGSAHEEAEKYIKEYSYLQNEIDNGKIAIEGINAGELEDKDILSRIIELSLYNWACDNGYELHNTKSLGHYFCREIQENNQGFYIGIMMDGYLPSQGIRKGSANLDLDVRGRFMETYYLQVVITKLNPEPNESSGTEMNEEAQKILNEVVDFAYKWGFNYYTELIRLAGEK
ncbi:MAG: hypothetical protein JW996_06080 [Candidatus Cloacimonetes bacterium]|nr:hypothetical protein [Candidatus Cloacimonadota bacterium]